MKSSFFAVTNYNLSIVTIAFFGFFASHMGNMMSGVTSAFNLSVGELPIVCGIVITLIVVTIIAWISFLTQKSTGALFCAFALIYSQFSIIFQYHLFVINGEIENPVALTPWRIMSTILAILYLISYFRQKRLNNQ